MAKRICPACGSDHVAKATRAQRKTFGAGPYDDIRVCGSCGRLFEAPWAAWMIWFCLICGWFTVLAGVLVLASVWYVNKDFKTVGSVTPVLVVPGLILPSVYRQMRLRRKKAATPPPPPK